MISSAFLQRCLGMALLMAALSDSSTAAKPERTCWKALSSFSRSSSSSSSSFVLASTADLTSMS